MTFLERYRQEQTWYGKVIVMELYHLVMTQKTKGWTIAATAGDFGVSISLVSENLKIADAMHKHPALINCASRVKALEKIR